MSKAKQAKAEETKEPEALCTVKLKDRPASVPDVKDGKVGELAVCEYLTGLPDGKLVEQVISIGREFKTFKDFFASHIEWISELRSRIPSRGYACKINIIDADGNANTFTWAEFCLQFFGVSDRWVRKQQQLHAEMAAQPVVEEPKEGDKEKEKKPSVEEVETEYEEKIERIETQASNLRLELGNLISLILKHKAAIPEPVVKAAEAAKFRVAPPQPVGNNMDTGDIGTDDLIDQIKKVTSKGKE